MATKSKRVHSHVYSTVLNGSINWPWSCTMVQKVRIWEVRMLRLTFRPRMKPDETWVTCKTRTSRSMRSCCKNGPAAVDRENGEQVMDYNDLGPRTTAWWRSRFSWGMAWGTEVTGLCGFWDGSCDIGKCGGGIVILALTDPYGWFTF